MRLITSFYSLLQIYCMCWVVPVTVTFLELKILVCRYI